MSVFLAREPIMRALSFVILIIALFLPVAASAQLNVLISGGFSGAYEKLLPEFERTSGIKVTTGSGASQGTGPQTIAAQLARGVPANVVILSREGLSELIAAKRIVAPACRSVVPISKIPSSPRPRAGGLSFFAGEPSCPSRRSLRQPGGHCDPSLAGREMRKCVW